MPTTPTAVSAVPDNASATVSFGASSTGPDLPIMRYKVTSSPGGRLVHHNDDQLHRQRAHERRGLHVRRQREKRRR